MHVVPHPDGWAVTRVGSARPIGVYFSRRFAVSAGRELAAHDCVQLHVFDDQRTLDYRQSYRVDESRLPEQPATATELLGIRLHYDSWCLRVARAESQRALDGWCDRELLDEMLTAITELVLHATLRNRSDCTLTIRHSGDQILVIVTPSGGAPSAEGRCVWASFRVRH